MGRRRSSSPRTPCGWESDLPTFRGTPPRVVRLRLAEFVSEAGASQLRAWDRSIPWLQRACGAVVDADTAASGWRAILEYELPRDFRRPDVLILENGVVVVLEIKGDPRATQAGRDQVLAYARDLSHYHAACHGRPVHPVLVTERGDAEARRIDGVHVVGAAGLHDLLLDLAYPGAEPPLAPEEFLSPDAYLPLPTIVQAARELFHHRELRPIKRARAATDPALRTITEIAKEAAATQSRHLVLLGGVPGAGKTLVGLQLVHAHWLDDLAVARASGAKPTAPAVYLSGNGPLVAVLQDALKREAQGKAQAGSRTFVQDIKKYVAYYDKRPQQVPPEHLIVFDEAQRAHDAERVAKVHKRANVGVSEPEHLIEFAERIPEWCVLVGLIGGGQAIHAGEEQGLPLWRRAVEGARDPAAWTVHAAADYEEPFLGAAFPTRWRPELNLDTEIRFHLTPKVHAFVEAVLDQGDPDKARPIAEELWEGGHRFLLTRDLAEARAYLRERYESAPEARYGLLASAKDKLLPDWGVDNTFQTTKQLRVGEWYNADPSHPRSCCQLTDVATEFSSQGLELDMALLAWGSDLLRKDGAWSIAQSRGTRDKIYDPEQMRRNVYRVLLTRGRDGTVLFIPLEPAFEDTAAYLQACGVRAIEST